ncbi:hypothetical protein M406DRAFT_76028 [Cryphonectria parasitica EP155]|uniref:AB hydrolase-1 domain-containing protein n=1 Tax=Cryphonectria parasitica (strain ATCC 38755 / EP155) TaxID=660469 RepID=A0A9P5CHW8_CRYP1|nr:uncharacterized protein M406DRAFT_76028 [Cryphonectria parasitica EP155]KAF3760369.1 hypothetical protein M406DRAFT_76028 [Cryphonectria parasitica EP155]
MGEHSPAPVGLGARLQQLEQFSHDDPRGRYLEASDHESLFKPHGFEEHIIDLGEVRMNYAVAGPDDKPALLLIPGQTESWWGYENAMRLLSESYQVYAVDLRGQGRSTWTPGRYSLDNFGNDLVRFIDLVIKRPVIVSGLSSGGVLSAWLSAFAKPGQVIAAVYEDPPLFASELTPAVGQSVRQTIAGPLFRIWSKWLGPQWSIGNEDGMVQAMAHELPSWIAKALTSIMSDTKTAPFMGPAPELKEYDPEWGDAFWNGRVALTCDHENMLKHVKVPVLFTHHFRHVDVNTGNLVGASSDTQIQHVQKLVEGAGNSFTYQSFPKMPHSMHEADPVCYVTTMTDWLATKGLGEALKPTKDQLPKKEESDGEEKYEPASLETAAPPTVKVDGVWNLSVQTPIGKQSVTLTLQSDGNKLSGALDGGEGRNEITEGTIDGSSVFFRASLKKPVRVRVSYKAQVDGDSMTGTAKTPLLPTINFSGKRAAASS